MVVVVLLVEVRKSIFFFQSLLILPVVQMDGMDNRRFKPYHLVLAAGWDTALDSKMRWMDGASRVTNTCGNK